MCGGLQTRCGRSGHCSWNLPGTLGDLRATPSLRASRISARCKALTLLGALAFRPDTDSPAGAVVDGQDAGGTKRHGVFAQRPCVAQPTAGSESCYAHETTHAGVSWQQTRARRVTPGRAAGSGSAKERARRSTGSWLKPLLAVRCLPASRRSLVAREPGQRYLRPGQRLRLPLGPFR